MKKQIAVMLLSFTILLCGCSSTQVTDIDITGKESAAVTDFGIRLFQQSMTENKNTLLSPLSALSALAMTANGADSNTLSQMEQVFGLPIEDLNSYLHAYMNSLPVHAANSIWIRDDKSLTIEKGFLQKNKDYYGAQINQVPFHSNTVRKINRWVSKNTDGMIDSIIDEISGDEVMYLINALAFDAEWKTVYEDSQISDGIFMKEDGTEQEVKFMYSQEHMYLEDENAEGFQKYYADGKSAFVALLPKKGVSVTDYIASFTGERLSKILHTAKDIPVNAAIPKFKNAYRIEMNKMLKNMGITDAFDYTVSDFSKIGRCESGNLFISEVLHKAYIAVDEKGTKAGAATAVSMNAGSTEPLGTKQIYLDRPFMYMIVDCEANVPIFIGTIMDMA